jgi:hypothetical protein
MRRLPSILFLANSLLLLLATLVTWHVAVSHDRKPEPAPVRRTWQLEATKDGLRLVHASRQRPKSYTWFLGGNLMEPGGLHRKITPQGDLHSFPDGSARTVPKEPRTWAGFQWEEGAATDGPKSIDNNFKLSLIPWRALTVPYEVLAAVTAIVPIGWVSRILRSQRRVLHGLCPTCGYDLRFSADRCPECGTAKLPMKPAGVAQPK